MVKNKSQKAKLDQMAQWKKERKLKKIAKQEKKQQKYQNQRKSKEKYQKTFDLVIVKDKNQKSLNWSQIFTGVKEKYKNFVAKIAHVDIEDDNIHCSTLQLDSNNQDREVQEKSRLWDFINKLDWQGKFRMILIQNLNDVQYDQSKLKRIFQKKVSIARIKQQNKEDDFDSKTQELNEYLYTVLQNDQNQTIDQTFKEHLLSKMDKRKNQEKVMKVKQWHGSLKVGQWYSHTNHVRVQSIENDEYKCIDNDQRQHTFSKNEILEMQSAQQYQKNIGLTQLELIEKLRTCRSQILKLMYYEKYTTDQFKNFIKGSNNLEEQQKNEEWLKNKLKGKRIEIIGNVHQNKLYLGKLTVRNLLSKKVQQIDSRSIQEIIFDQCRYYLKEENTNNNFDVNQDIKEGDCFAYSNYYKILEIIDEKIIVLDEKDRKQQLKKQFLETQCQSADNFEKKKNMSLRDIVEMLHGIHSQIFTIEYKTSQEFQNSYEKFQQIDKETLADPKKLRKICKSIVYHKQTISVARQVEIDEVLSFSKIYDFEQKRVIEVDHRSIKSLIYKNMRYCKS